MRESYDTNLKNAMHLYAQKSAEEFPSDDVVSDITFSPSFEKKMDKEIHRRKHSYFRIFDTAAKRVASIAAVFVLLLTLTLSVRAIRIPIVNMITTFWNQFFSVSYEGDTVDVITEVYGLSVTPVGFTKVKEYRDDISVSEEYTAEGGAMIRFKQTITDGTETQIDNEYATFTIIEVDEKEVYLVVGKDESVKQAIWVEGTYAFSLTCIGDISTDMITDIITNVQLLDRA